VGDVFTVEQRAKFTALFSSVWGIAAVAGPAVGGVITDVVSWRWVFYINVPICLIAAAMLWRFFPENVERKKHRLDFLGAGLLTLAITALLLATSARQTASVDASVAWALVIGAAVLLIAFVQVERRAPEPVLPLGLLALRTVNITALTLLLVGGLQFATSSFVPLMVQGVYGSTAALAGALLIPQSIGWPLGSWLGGRMIMRMGFRPTLLLGLSAIAAGSVPFILVDQQLPLAWVGLIVAIQGFGLGLTTLSTTIAAQSSVDWGQRGVVTSAVLFARSMGASLGVTVLGAMLASDFARRMEGVNLGTAANVREAAALLEPTVRSTIDPTTLVVLQAALSSALHPVWIGVALLSVAALFVGFWFPRVKVTQPAWGPPKVQETAEA
jgi:MFS family permease